MTRTGTPTQDARAPLLRVEAVELAVAGRPLLAGLSLRVLPGERWCVLGPNGSGKTTLLQLLAGLRVPDRGEILLEGTPYRRWDAREAAAARGYLAQTQGYAFRSTVRACVLLGRHPHLGRLGWPSAQDDEHVLAAMSAMDLALLGERDVLTLSGGEQQRTRLAALLAQDPRLYLLDEPTTHLDLGHQAALFQTLTAACERAAKAVVFSTHDLALAARFSTHALVLGGARCSARIGPSAQLLSDGVLSAAFGFPIATVRTPDGLAFVPRW